MRQNHTNMILCFTCVLILGGKKWALLVAESKHYYNYRHQVDICHAYQILRRGSFKKKSLEEVALEMKTSLFSCMTTLQIIHITRGLTL